MAELRNSKWKFVTSGSLAGTAGIGGDALSIGVARGLIVLTSPAGATAPFKYYIGTASVGLGPPIGLSYSAPEFFSTGKLYMLSAFRGTELKSSDIEGICQIVDVSAAGIRGASGSVMLLGMSLTGVVKDIVENEFGPKALARRVVFGPANGVVHLGRTLWHLFHSDDSNLVADWSSAKALLVMRGDMLSFGIGISRGIGMLSVGNVVPEAPVIDLPITPDKGPTRSSAYNLQIVLPADTLFDINKDVIKPAAEASLRKAGDSIKAQPVSLVMLTGHTDDTGSDALNLGLSNRRAGNVAQWLISHGYIDAKRVKWVGAGKTQPKVPNSNAAARQTNRRVEITIYGTVKSVPT